MGLNYGSLHNEYEVYITLNNNNTSLAANTTFDATHDTKTNLMSCHSNPNLRQLKHASS